MTWQLALSIVGLALVLGGGIALGYRMAWSDAQDAARSMIGKALRLRDERIEELDAEADASDDLVQEFADTHARDLETIRMLRARLARYESPELDAGKFPHPDEDDAVPFVWSDSDKSFVREHDGSTVDYVEMPGLPRSGD